MSDKTVQAAGPIKHLCCSVKIVPEHSASQLMTAERQIVSFIPKPRARFRLRGPPGLPEGASDTSPVLSHSTACGHNTYFICYFIRLSMIKLN